MANESLCADRICIVTGAGRGIGRAHAMMLASHGARVVVNDLGGGVDGTGASSSPAEEVVAEITATGGEAVANGDDVSTWDGAGSLVQHAIDAFGGLDVLVNNAGILRDRMFANMTEAEWDTVVAVHLKGTFAPMRHATAYWRDRAKAGHSNDARIINTSSASGLFGNPGQSNYGAAKAAIAALTIITSYELERYGVTVNAIAPSALTRMTENHMRGEMDEEQRVAFDPRLVSPIVTWLASSESREVTGRVFMASGSTLGVLEGWHPGPQVSPIDDPTVLGPVVRDLLGRARTNADMLGNDRPNRF